jgi:hypothetical protein
VDAKKDVTRPFGRSCEIRPEVGRPIGPSRKIWAFPLEIDGSAEYLPEVVSEKHESGGSRDRGTGEVRLPERVSKELVMPPKMPNLYTSEKSLATLQIVWLRSGECVPATNLSDAEIIEIALVHVDMGDHQPG